MPGSSTFRSLTRLVIGGVLNSLDGIAGRLTAWERRTTAPVAPDETSASQEAGLQPASPAAILASPEPSAGPETTADWATYALVGLLIHSQARLEHYAHTTERATQVLGAWGDLLGGPLYRSRWLGPVRRRVDVLAARGQQQVDHWVATGRQETAYSRRLAHAALTERVDNAIEYLTSNDEVQELVQSQSAGLVDEVIEETRERTVSADNFLESVVRSVLRRPPRGHLPEPPPALKARAEEHTRQLHHSRTLPK
jgi:hypothetical protein